MTKKPDWRAWRSYAIFQPGKVLEIIQVNVRDRWALEALMWAGANGCTPIDHPAPRWSAYVFNLRQMGVPIRTHHEAHSGGFLAGMGATSSNARSNRSPPMRSQRRERARLHARKRRRLLLGDCPAWPPPCHPVQGWYSMDNPASEKRGQGALEGAELLQTREALIRLWPTSEGPVPPEIAALPEKIRRAGHGEGV